MRYFLIVDDEQLICEIIELTLHSKLNIDIEIAYSGREALEVISQKGIPEFIVTDYRMPDGDGLFLWNALQSRGIHSPFVICSGDALNLMREKFPGAYAHLQKPKMVEPLLEIITAYIEKGSSVVGPGQYVPIRITHLLRSGELNCDLYMKLSDEKYVKVLNKGETFMLPEAERFTSKNLSHLYITKSDSATFLQFFSQQLELLESNEKLDPEIKAKMSLENIDVVDRLSKTLGWTPEVVNMAKKSINLAISAVSAHPNILKILKHRLNDNETPYMQHVGPLAMVSCVFCQQLGWTSDSAQLKLAMAALMHDMSLDDSYLKHIKSWNQSARNDKERSIEVDRYRNHPTDAALLVQSIKNLPPDIDQIIHQHHEAPDGAGFPRSLIHSRISPMSALFIIAEDLLEYIGEEQNMAPVVMKFVKEREQIYNEGNFKRVFQVLKHHLIVNK